MTDLATWLLARIAEREKVAHAAAARVRRWPKTTRPPWVQARAFAQTERFAALEAFEGRETPDEVLAWCAALRQIVELHTGNHECVAWCEQTAEDIADGDPPRTRTTYVHPDFINADDPTLRLLALPFADRPGYDPSWAVIG